MKLRRMRQKAAAAFSAAVLAVSACGTCLTAAPAAAADLNFGDALKLSLYFYDANECGCEVDENPLTWRGNCHTYDAEASLDNAQGLSSASKSAIMEQNGGASVVDVSGGYHDAGDHIKFSMTMGFSAACLGWSYFTYPEAYEETGSTDHLLSILKHTCDYFMKVTYLDANDDVIAFCYQVAAEGEDHNTWTAPEVQTMNRTTYWADASHPSADASGQMAAALATTALAFQDVDAAYSAECLKYANALAEFTKKYPQATYDGVGSMYASGSQSDDVAWSEVWCAIANNGGTLPSSFTPTYKLTGQGCYNNDQYDGWMYSWDKVWSGYAALLAEVGYEKNTYVEEMKSSLNKQGGLTTSKYNAAGWGASRYNCALQMLALHIADATNDTSYADAAKYQMDYILGANTLHYSFLSGYGESWPTHIHHRAANPNRSSCTYTLYGALIGGPDSSGNYSDDTEQYQFTEPALDYNGCYALAIAGLCSYFGAGDGSGADAIAAAATEIDETHVFGPWGSGEQTTEPSETETTEPSETETTEPSETETTEPSETETEPSSEDNPDVGQTDSNVPVTGKYGDTNVDGDVNIADVILLNRAMLGDGAMSDEGKALADVDQSGIVDATDSLTILKFIVELVDALPV